jgi:hypothetical protein
MILHSLLPGLSLAYPAVIPFHHLGLLGGEVLVLLLKSLL